MVTAEPRSPERWEWMERKALKQWTLDKKTSHPPRLEVRIYVYKVRDFSLPYLKLVCSKY